MAVEEATVSAPTVAMAAKKAIVTAVKMADAAATMIAVTTTDVAVTTTALTTTDAEVIAQTVAMTVDHADRDHLLQILVVDLLSTEEDHLPRERPIHMFHLQAIAHVVASVVKDVIALLLLDVLNSEDATIPSAMDIVAETVRRTPEDVLHPRDTVETLTKHRHPGLRIAIVRGRVRLLPIVTVEEMYGAATTTCPHAARQLLHHPKSMMRLLIVPRTGLLLRRTTQTAHKAPLTLLAAEACLARFTTITRPRRELTTVP